MCVCVVGLYLSVSYYQSTGSDLDSPRASHRRAQRSHRAQVTQEGASPTGSPRRRRKHRHTDIPHHGDPHVNGQTEANSERPLSLSVLTRGRVPNSFILHDDIFVDGPQNIAAVPNIECGPHGTLNDDLGDSAGRNSGSISHTAQVPVTESAPLNGNTPHNIPVGVVHPIPAAMDTAVTIASVQPGANMVNMSTETGQFDTTQKNGKADPPPPLPPRKYPPGLIRPKPKPRTKTETRTVSQRRTGVIEGQELQLPCLPPRENQSSFDSMEAFAGSHENLSHSSGKSLRKDLIMNSELQNTDANKCNVPNIGVSEGNVVSVCGTTSESTNIPDTQDTNVTNSNEQLSTQTSRTSTSSCVSGTSDSGVETPAQPDGSECVRVGRESIGAQIVVTATAVEHPQISRVSGGGPHGPHICLPITSAPSTPSPPVLTSSSPPLDTGCPVAHSVTDSVQTMIASAQALPTAMTSMPADSTMTSDATANKDASILDGPNQMINTSSSLPIASQSGLDDIMLVGNDESDNHFINNLVTIRSQLSETEREQNRQSIQQHLKQWHQQRALSQGSAPPPKPKRSHSLGTGESPPRSPPAALLRSHSSATATPPRSTGATPVLSTSVQPVISGASPRSVSSSSTDQEGVAQSPPRASAGSPPPTPPPREPRIPHPNTPPAPPPREGSQLSSQATGRSAVPPPPPPRDSSSLGTASSQAMGSAAQAIPVPRTTVADTPSSGSSPNVNSGGSPDRQAIKQELLRWRQRHGLREAQMNVPDGSSSQVGIAPDNITADAVGAIRRDRSNGERYFLHLYILNFKTILLKRPVRFCNNMVKIDL